MKKEIEKHFDLELPKEEITETGFYNVKRTVGGVEDIIEILFYSNRDMTIAEKDKEKRQVIEKTAAVSTEIVKNERSKVRSAS